MAIESPSSLPFHKTIPQQRVPLDKGPFFVAKRCVQELGVHLVVVEDIAIVVATVLGKDTGTASDNIPSDAGCAATSSATVDRTGNTSRASSPSTIATEDSTKSTEETSILGSEHRGIITQEKPATVPKQEEAVSIIHCPGDIRLGIRSTVLKANNRDVEQALKQKWMHLPQPLALERFLTGISKSSNNLNHSMDVASHE